MIAAVGRCTYQAMEPVEHRRHAHQVSRAIVEFDRAEVARIPRLVWMYPNVHIYGSFGQDLRCSSFEQMTLTSQKVIPGIIKLLSW